jgi:xylulokinase
MLLLGIDIGTSSIKISVVDSATQRSVASISHPEKEIKIISPQPGWAEQSPETWWDHSVEAIQKLNASGKYDSKNIGAIGIAYQMHGLVLVDKEQNSIRNSIIWCDSRAVSYGEAAFQKLGRKECLSTLLNSPGNFTAAKLAWVKENEPQVYKRIDKIMLPGDFISMKLTGEITTTISALSEGIFWDFRENSISEMIMDYFGFDDYLFPAIRDVFCEHGGLKPSVAETLSLRAGIPVTYKAGDQLNTALSLNVLEPGEVAANAGTSGVIYAVSDDITYDPQSRINSFAHVNHEKENKRIGVLLCINGAGITNSWIRSLAKKESFDQLNKEIESIPPGSEGLIFLPFGNGAERMLKNKLAEAHIHGIDFNIHSLAHLYRAGQEGIAFAFRYGMDIMADYGIQPSVIRAGHTNLFLSDVFVEAFVNATGIPVELYQSDGSGGAAIGAGIGCKEFSIKEAFAHLTPIKRVEVTDAMIYNELYEQWEEKLENELTILNQKIEA